MARATLLLGTNLGDKLANLQNCVSSLSGTVGDFEMQSAVYETPAWGFTSRHSFFNQVVVLNTELAPGELLSKILQIEKELGRNRTISSNSKGYQDRIMDIDILYYDQQIVETDLLSIPHPQIQYRLFTLAPLNELMPDFIHPKLLKSNKDLLIACEDNSPLKKL